MLIYVVIIEGHNFDTTPTVFQSKEKAFASVADWVKQQWEDEMEPDPMPADPENMVKMYFKVMHGEESYEIHTCCLED